jgi:hypothetical protein
MINDRQLGFGFTPPCILPSFVIATFLGLAVAKKKAKVFWIITPTVFASSVLLLFALFLFGEYRKHGQQTLGAGGGVALLLLIGLGVLLAIVYGAFALGFTLRPKKNEQTG